MTLEEWVAAVCAELGIEAPDTKTVLDFARDVAHRVDRPAAPLTALLVGLAARSTADLPSLMEQVRGLLPVESAD
jgi:hypothetical protein